MFWPPLVCHSRESGNPVVSFWTAACAGMTLWPPHPAVPWAPPASPAVGRGVLDCRLRRNDTCWIPACAGRTLGPPHPASLDGWPPSPAGGEAGFPLTRPGLRHCLRPGRPLPRWGEAYWTAAYAGMTPAGFPLVQESHCGPPHPAVPWAPPASPARGEAFWVPACAGMTHGAQE